MRISVIFIVCLFALTACGHPDTTLTMPPRSASSLAQVEVIQFSAKPEGYLIMGRAYAWSNVPVSRRKGYETAVKRLRERAASVGAEALWVPSVETIHLPAVQQRWMERSEGWQRDWSGGEAEYVTPHELMGVLLVRP